MSRYVYISCEHSELEQVKSLCGFLEISNCVIELPPSNTHSSFYRYIEDAIERSDAFVAVAAGGLEGSTWLNFALHYADNLNRSRNSPRPRLFGLQVQGYKVPNVSKRIELEWLNESNRELLLADLFRRG